MYSDYEVECWYTGRPFGRGPGEEEKEEKAFPVLTDEEVERIFLGLPLEEKRSVAPVTVYGEVKGRTAWPRPFSAVRAPGEGDCRPRTLTA